MKKEQEAELDKLKTYLEYAKKDNLDKFILDVKTAETVLSMLKEKDKEIEKLEKQSKNFDKQAQQYFEQTIYLDKIIDLMAEEIDETDRGYNDYCQMKKECDENCKNCIKQYFERKSKECQ